MLKSTHEVQEVTARQAGEYCQGLQDAVMAAVKEYCRGQKMGFAVTFIAAVLTQMAAKSWRKQYHDAQIPNVLAEMARIGLRDNADDLHAEVLRRAGKGAVR